MTPLEVEYSPSSMVDDIEPLLERYAADSAAARAEVPPAVVPYGDRSAELIDVFEAADASVVHVFFHGGYWQQLGRRDASFPAPALVDRGVTYAAPGYTLAPDATLAEIVEEARTAVEVVVDHVGDGVPLIVSGSSAGAHLAAMVLLADWGERGFDRCPIEAAVLLSGVFDLRPLVDTYVNEPLGLDADTAWELSPIRLAQESALGALDAGRKAIVAVGGHETKSFKSQSGDMAWALDRSGHEVVTLEIEHRNHFDIVHDLADPSTELGAAVRTLEPSA